MVKKHSQVLMEYTLCLLLLVAPLIFYPKIQNFSNLPKSTFIQLLVGILWICWLLKAYQKQRVQLIKHPLLLVIVLWILWSGFTILWALDKYSAIMLWLHWFLCMICFLIVVHSLKTIKQIDRLVIYLVLGANIVAVLGFLQYIFGMGIIPQAAVPGATFFHRNIAAQFIVFVWPFSIMLFVSSKSKKGIAPPTQDATQPVEKSGNGEKVCFFCKPLQAINKKQTWLLAGSQIILITFLCFTKTRAAWVAALISLLILIFLIFITKSWKMFKKHINKQKALALSISVIFIFLMANIPPHKEAEASKQVRLMTSKETFESIFQIGKGTASTRIAIWLNTLHMVKDYLPLGVGLGNWYIYYPHYYKASKNDISFSLKQQPTKVHNTPLQLLAETSVVGVLIYMSIFIVLLWRFFTVYYLAKDSAVKVRLLFVLMAIASFFVNSLFTFPLQMAIPPLILMVSLAFFVVLENHIKQENQFFSLTTSKKKLIPLILCSVFFTSFITIFNIRAILADGHLLKSILFNHQKEWKMAKEEAEKAKNYIPWRHEIWFELSIANDRLGLYEEAINSTSRSLKFHPNLMNSYLNLSHTYLKKRDFINAQKNIQKVLDLKPNCDEAVFTLGLIKEKQILIPEAIQYYEKTTKVNKNHANAYLHLGTIYYKLGQLKKAKEYLQQVIKINPEMHGPHLFLGFVYSREKKWHQAVFSYKEAIRKNPQLGTAHLNIAVAYYMLGDHGAALRHGKISKQLGVFQTDLVMKQLQTNKKIELKLK